MPPPAIAGSSRQLAAVILTSSRARQPGRCPLAATLPNPMKAPRRGIFLNLVEDSWIGDAAPPLTRTAVADRSLCCFPLPVGEEEIAVLHVQQSDPALSHREREAAERRFSQTDAG